MAKAAIGFRAHTGWAACVVLAGPAQSPHVIDRRRVEMIERGLPLQVFHKAGSMSPAKAEALVDRATESATKMAEAAVRELAKEFDIRVAGVVLGSGRAPTSVARAVASHAGKHAAEGELFRQALVEACTACRLAVTGIRERELPERAAEMLHFEPDQLRTRIAELGRPLGPPWTKDHKDAALAAWIALASGR